MEADFVEFFRQISSEYTLVFSVHSKLKSATEQISLEEVEENIKNPKNLYVYEKEDALKYKLYFKLSNSIAHKYVVEINKFEKTIKIVTI
ncbi:MAG: hypothetical protein Q7K42_05855, partial [Candidatus Diapherotrites archaeon]|nr:hypothetical protein [Candidatus Diapherotrites archaeon]